MQKVIYAHGITAIGLHEVMQLLL